VAITKGVSHPRCLSRTPKKCVAKINCVIVKSCVLGRWREIWRNCFGSGLEAFMSRVLTESRANSPAPLWPTQKSWCTATCLVRFRRCVALRKGLREWVNSFIGHCAVCLPCIRAASLYLDLCPALKLHLSIYTNLLYIEKGWFYFYKNVFTFYVARNNRHSGKLDGLFFIFYCFSKRILLKVILSFFYDFRTA
jgi:hypothetical protein